MKDIFLVASAIVSIAVTIFFIIIFIKDYVKRNRIEKQSLIEQIQQYQKTIRENKTQADARLQDYERNRISRDINLVLGYTNDKLVDIIIEYSPDKLMSAKTLDEIKAEINKAKDNYDFDNLIKETYLPIVGAEHFYVYQMELQRLKSIVRLHKELTSKEIIEQIDFYMQNHFYNINEIELARCIEPISNNLEKDDEFEFFEDDEVIDIAKLITNRFNICITKNGMEDILNPSDHTSYSRSISGIRKLFSRILFHSEIVYSQLSCLDDDIFLDAAEKYFFCAVCYDIKHFKTFLPEIINYVKDHRTYQSN